jgi:DNA-binding transcriptional ArsR family regulator
METPGSVEALDGRLPARLAATLPPRMQDALDHPVRRDVLRNLSRDRRPRSVAEIRTDLQVFRMSQLGYHLQVLRRSGAVASASNGEPQAKVRYASEVGEDGKVKAVLRATERGDQVRREALAAANASPLLTMFRVPRPVRTIRLRGRSRPEGDR